MLSSVALCGALLLVAATAVTAQSTPPTKHASITWTNNEAGSASFSVLLDAFGDQNGTFAYVAETSTSPTAIDVYRYNTSSDNSTGLQKLVAACDYAWPDVVFPIVLDDTVLMVCGPYLRAFPVASWRGGSWPTPPSWESSALPCNATAITYGDGLVYASCWSGYVFALAPANGMLIWAASVDVSTPAEYYWRQQLLFAGGVVVVVEGAATALHAASGAALWNLSSIPRTNAIEGRCAASPDGTTLYFITGPPFVPKAQAPDDDAAHHTSYSVIAVAALTGSVRWNTTIVVTHSGSQSSPTFKRHMVATRDAVLVYVYTGWESTAYGLDVAGNVTWRAHYSLENPAVFSEPITVNDHTEIVVCDSNCSGIHPRTGPTATWSFGISSNENIVNVRGVPGTSNSFEVLYWGAGWYATLDRVLVAPPLPTPAPPAFVLVKTCAAASHCSGSSCKIDTTFVGCDGHGHNYTCVRNRELRIDSFAARNCSGGVTASQVLFKELCTDSGGTSMELLVC